MLRSDDGGAHFIPLKGDPTGDDFHTLWIDPKNPDRQILGVDQGTLVTFNGGKTWSSWFNQPTGANLSRLDRQPLPVPRFTARSRIRAPPRCRAAATASTTASPCASSTRSPPAGRATRSRPIPTIPISSTAARVDRLDLKSGQTRNVDPTLAFPDEYRGEWTLPLTFGKRDHALYFGNQRSVPDAPTAGRPGARSAPT